MALTNYTELQASIANWMHRTNLTGDIPEFITLAEARIRALLTSRLQQEVSPILTVAGVEYVTMPNSALNIRSLSIPSVMPTIDYMAPNIFNEQFGMGDAGVPRCYTVIGELIYLGPTPDAVYTIHAALSSEFDSLSGSVASNPLLAKWPNVYLWGALTEASKFCRAQDWLAGFNSDFLQAMDSVNTREWNTPGQMQVRTDARNP